MLSGYLPGLWRKNALLSFTLIASRPSKIISLTFHRTRKEWTWEFIDELVWLGYERGFGVYTHSTSYTKKVKGGEWLYDLSWIDEDDREGKFNGFGLICEIEWNTDIDSILYDFHKLLVAKSPLKLMLFQYNHDYLGMAELVKELGFGLKINTVVSSANVDEDLTAFISAVKPNRWKLFQVLPVGGQNDGKVEEMVISDKQFNDFVQRHMGLESVTRVVPESNELMTGSYAMVDPAGRFFDNAEGKHRYSKPILEVGARLAIQEVQQDYSKFIKRDGAWDFTQTKNSKLFSRITLGGDVASAKTTIGLKLAERLGFRFTSMGLESRERAKAVGMDIAEYQKLCLQNPEMDREADSAFSSKCNSSENLVIDYRLARHFIKDAFHIYLKVSDKEALRRLRNAGRTDENPEGFRKRNELFEQQFKKAHNIDLALAEPFDLEIDTEAFASPEAIVEYIINQLPR